MSQLKVDTITDEEGTGTPDFPNGATLDGAAAYSRDNILGTVSESSGTPTGAIIQRGSNANGEFVRYADGTQVCWRNSNLTLTQASTLRWDRRWDFPVTFSDSAFYADLIMEGFGPTNYSNTNVGAARVTSRGTSFVSFNIYRAGDNESAIPSNSEMDVRAYAIGRWY
jgi:hypothetical protein